MATLQKDIAEHAEKIGNNPALGIVIESPNERSSKANIILDMSKLDLFLACHYRYYVRYVLNRAERKKSEALDKGSLLHEGYDLYYSLLQKGAPFNDRMHACLHKMREISANPNLCHLEDEDIALVTSAAMENLEYWRFEDEQLEIILVEQPFAHCIYEDDYVRIILSGKIDILCNFPGLGNNASYVNLPIDHKSFSRASEVLRLSNQFMCYADAVGSNYLYVNRVGLQKTVPPGEKFVRKMLSYDEAILQEWKEGVKDIILNEYLPCVAANRWSQNFTSCFKFNRKCESYEICDTSGSEAKEFKLLNEMTEGSPWDVTASFKKS
jgi:hypothetical protein